MKRRAARGNASLYLNTLGRYEEAVTEAERAATMVSELDDEYLVARIHALKGRALAGLGRFEEAAGLLRSTIEAMVKFGDPGNEAVAEEFLGEALMGLNRRAEGVAAWQRSIELRRGLDDEQVERLAARLADLE